MVLGEACLHLTEQNTPLGAWSKEERERRTFSFKTRRKKRKEEKIFAKFLKTQFVDSSITYIERSFGPSNCAKTWVFVKTSHPPASIGRSSLVVSTYCSQEHSMSFCPFMKSDECRRKGKEVI